MTQRVELLAGQRQKGESYRAIVACNDYLRMELTRSVRHVHEGYANTRKSTHVPRSLLRPSGVEWRQMASETRPIRTLQRWSTHYDWQVGPRPDVLPVSEAAIDRLPGTVSSGRFGQRGTVRRIPSMALRVSRWPLGERPVSLFV